MTTLYDLTVEYQKLLDIALESDEISDETFYYIQKLDGAIEQKIENIAYVIKELENNAGIVNNEIDRLSERATRYYKNLKTLKKYVVSTMEQLGKKRIETPTMTLGVRKSESTEIDK